jgi:hypothetical protein
MQCARIVLSQAAPSSPSLPANLCKGRPDMGAMCGEGVCAAANGEDIVGEGQMGVAVEGAMRVRGKGATEDPSRGRKV